MVKITISIYPKAELYEKLSKFAEGQNRSLNNYILTLLNMHVENMERNKPDGDKK